MGAATLPTGSPSRRPLWFALGAVGVLLVVALIVVLVVWRGGAGTPSGSDTLPGTRPTPSATAEPLAVASAAPTASAPAGPHPATCEAIYSPAMMATFSETRSLNPSWSSDPQAAMQAGTQDSELASMIQSAEHLTCIWGSEGGGSDSGLTTNVVFVTPEQSEAAHQRLNALGQSCYEELGGIRCVMESTTEGEGTSGESHFLRDGIWLATHYVNAGPDGYTHDMVGTVWAGA
ncbi:hypothetical protein E3O42_16720 [Cryobacterium adonitolivorans]|uniref:DUF3558 domain-containing protein n=1 Tax=Cryobacterium adonitolivorans TaxID=1259189 RepID=A0A4R8W1L6_9MICO|nr:hypothetical protein [Cryobacterium adonitolivorans]TFB96781.1 hypothetical protein E3O42_16720 [Cryobacterium adonitolivorans]